MRMCKWPGRRSGLWQRGHFELPSFVCSRQSLLWTTHLCCPFLTFCHLWRPSCVLAYSYSYSHRLCLAWWLVALFRQQHGVLWPPEKVQHHHSALPQWFPLALCQYKAPCIWTCGKKHHAHSNKGAYQRTCMHVCVHAGVVCIHKCVRCFGGRCSKWRKTCRNETTSKNFFGPIPAKFSKLHKQVRFVSV